MSASKALALALLLPLAAACGKKPPELHPLSRLPASFDAASPLESRVCALPAELLQFYRAADRSPDYKVYLPSPSEKALLLEYLRLLPPVYQRVFRERCYGIHFVEGLLGNGLTSWAIGPDGKVYFHILLNPATLRATISETLTERERSCFLPRSGWEVRVNAGAAYKGLFYVLAHEATHGLDYALGVTPWTDDAMPAYYWPEKPLLGKFFYESWIDYSHADRKHDFPGRANITFYGFGGGPKVAIGEAMPLYRGLLGSGFVSLYGAKSWAEDLAELATFAVLTRRLGQPYSVSLATPGPSYRVDTLAGPAAARADRVLGELEGLK